MKVSRNEIQHNLNREDVSIIARELELSGDMVRKVLTGERQNEKVWALAERVAEENIRKIKAISKAGAELSAK